MVERLVPLVSAFVAAESRSRSRRCTLRRHGPGEEAAVAAFPAVQATSRARSYEHLFARTRWIKDRFKRYQRYWPLEDRTLAMIFEKPSTRTRLSFEAGMHQLGGAAIYLYTRDSQLGRGEPVEDAAQVISRMCDVVMIRTFEQEIIERFAAQLARAGDQRPDQRVPPLPDPGRRLHLHRAPRRDHAARRWPGSATRTTCATPGCRRRRSSTSS